MDLLHDFDFFQYSNIQGIDQLFINNIGLLVLLNQSIELLANQLILIFIARMFILNQYTSIQLSIFFEILYQLIFLLFVLYVFANKVVTIVYLLLFICILIQTDKFLLYRYVFYILLVLTLVYHIVSDSRLRQHFGIHMLQLDVLTIR